MFFFEKKSSSHFTWREGQGRGRWEGGGGTVTYMKFALALSAGVLVSYGSLRLTVVLYTRALRWRYGSQRLADVQASFDFGCF